MAKRYRRRFIPILGTRVKIKYHRKAMYDGDEKLDGTFVPTTMTIHIGPKAPGSTLLHEAIHGCLEISGVSNLLTLKVEEAVVSAIEMGLKDYFVF